MQIDVLGTTAHILPEPRSAADDVQGATLGAGASREEAKTAGMESVLRTKQPTRSQWLRSLSPYFSSLFMAFCLLSSNVALANSGGKTGYSTAGCTCHSGGTAPTVTFSGTPSGPVEPGTKLLLKLLITHKATGQTHGGFDVSVTGGTLSTVSGDSSTQILAGEATHSGAKAAVSGVTEFQFNWTAPTTPGTYSIRGVGNSVNKNGGSSGDMYALATSLSIVVASSCADNDGDGFSDKACGGTDCNDGNASINPNASESCDSIDNDCDSLVDDNDVNVSGQKTYFRDSDNDGFGSASVSTKTCSTTAPSGYVTNSTDCNDASASINPSAQEICNSIDDDCDSQTDDADSSVTGQKTYFRDADGDSFGTASSTTKTCASAAPVGYSNNNSDCNDGNASVSPVAQEICNSIDDDCDNQIDDADNSIVGQSTYFQDADNDSFGNANTSTKTCASSAPTGFVANNKDCNDGNAAVNPSAKEICNSIDDDCDALIDDSDSSVTGQKTYYADSDADGFGNPSSTKLTCSSQIPSGYVTNNTDCNDADRKVNPNAQEVCNSIDDDCDAKTDDADPSVTGQFTYFVDADKDGYGSASTTTDSCSLTAPSGFSAEAGDCNDADSTVNPKVTETCDSRDNDCDGLVDDADGSVQGQKTYYQDSDGDGYGGTKTKLTCSSTAPSGYVSTSTDCNDSSVSIHPGATDVCGDGIDQDCNGSDLSCSTVDNDLDGFTPNQGDCNDNNASIHPGASEVCSDNIDQDCSGSDLSCNAVDADKDNYTPNQGDCNDNNPAIHPGAADVCGDGVDQDCASGDLSCNDVDNDLDTFTENEGDCDDADIDINPNAEEIPYDDVDQDCDLADLTDVDSDGFDGGLEGNDCDDEDDAIHPGAAEVCGDGIDNNCDDVDEICPTPTPEPVTPTPEPITPTPVGVTPTPVLGTETPGTGTPDVTATVTPEVSATPEITDVPEPTTPPDVATPTLPHETATPVQESPTPSTSPTPSSDGSDGPSCACNQHSTEPPATLGATFLLGALLLSLRRRRA